MNSTREHLGRRLRTLRLIHYAGWLARRWHDPAFPAAFPWFNTQIYWEERILELREQIALMQEPPVPGRRSALARASARQRPGGFRMPSSRLRGSRTFGGDGSRSGSMGVVAASGQ